MEIDYTSNVIDLPGGQHLSDTYLDIHPLGAVPVLKTSSYTIFESVAIVLQLIDEHPEKKLAPEVGTEARASYYQWCVFACAELDPPIMTVYDYSMREPAHMWPPGWLHDAKLAERGRSEFATRAKALSNVLNDHDYLLGNDFSGADILVGHSCFMATFTGLIGDHPALIDYHERLQQRPAFQKAYPQLTGR